MERNIKIDAITLKKIELGESNVGVTLLTSEDEVIFVMAFGAMKPKSKLFGSVNPFVEATWNLYFDPVKEFYRAKDVDINNFNQDIQLSLKGFYTATLFLEIALKSQGSEGVYSLLKESIYYLGKGINRVMVLLQFFLRLLNRQGLLPSFSRCSHCDRRVEKESLYLNRLSEVVCSSCIDGRDNPELNPGILMYCNNTPGMELEKALKISLSKESTEILKKSLIRLIEKFIGGKLLTLNSSNGLI